MFIISEDLIALNKKLADTFEHHSDHPDYIPHMTLAYVLPGAADFMLDNDMLEHISLKLKEGSWEHVKNYSIELPIGK